MQNIYETFEFYKIKEMLFEVSKTEVGALYIEEMEMLPSFTAVNEALEDLKEVLSIIQRYGPMPIRVSHNALRMIDEAKKTSILTPRDLDMIAEDVLTSLSLIKFIKKIDLLYPRIKEIISHFEDLTNLEKEIHRVINTSQAIKDDASENLFSIRKKIKKFEKLLQDKIATLSVGYTQYMSDSNITIRDGHFVLPIKTVYKNKVHGIIHDISDSGNTTFIEPLEIVQINNDITALKVEENDEIRKILKALTGLVLLQEDEIIKNNAIIGKLDFLSAKAQLAINRNYEIASFVSERMLDLSHAAHPLIDPEKVVRNDFHLDDEKRIIVISGPNAGGKTVSLKTVGMCVLMNQCGLAIPVRKATLGYFNHIYIDIGDNQSLSDNLSTFSAHMSQIAEILHVINSKDLLLVDELGTGTDPKEGEGIALSVVKYLEKKHAFAMISSHFSSLKEYAFTSNIIDNASMIFDEKNLIPTYVFKQGIPGKSYALDVAFRYGIPSSVIEEAKIYMEEHQGSKDVSDLISMLQEKYNSVNKYEHELKNKTSELERKEKKLLADQENLSIRRENLLKEVSDTKKDMIEKAKQEVSFIMSKLNGGDMKLHEIIALKKELENLEENEEIDEYNEKISLEDYVSVPSLGVYGRVKELKGNKAYVVSDNGLSFSVNVNNLHKEEKPKPRKVKQTSDYERLINTSVSLQLNIIGLYVSEAVEKLTKYIDACRIKNLKQVRIIHGFGSGALRKATHEYLKKQKDLTFRSGNEYEGGGGATVVIFK